LADALAARDENVRDYCRGKIAKVKVPKYVSFVDTYPMTASGESQKHKLREMGATWLTERGIAPA